MKSANFLKDYSKLTPKYIIDAKIAGYKDNKGNSINTLAKKYGTTP